MKKLTETQKAIRVVDATMRIMGGPGSAQEDAWQKVKRAAEKVEGPQPAPNSNYTAALIEIFCWLNGESGDFPFRKPKEGAYYWRSEMIKRLNAAKKQHCV